VIWYSPRIVEADNPHSIGQKPPLHALARGRDSSLGLDVRGRAGRDLALRRASFPGRPVRAGRGRARPGLRPQAHPPVAARGRRHRGGAGGGLPFPDDGAALHHPNELGPHHRPLRRLRPPGRQAALRRQHHAAGYCGGRPEPGRHGPSSGRRARGRQLGGSSHAVLRGGAGPAHSTPLPVRGRPRRRRADARPDPGDGFAFRRGLALLRPCNLSAAGGVGGAARHGSPRLGRGFPGPDDGSAEDPGGADRHHPDDGTRLRRALRLLARRRQARCGAGFWRRPDPLCARDRGGPARAAAGEV
ncbi:MAG: Permease of the drug/metabolite transporter (DMT) superfamily, partial [uncultured Rubrobacteraceae bacterium]